MTTGRICVPTGNKISCRCWTARKINSYRQEILVFLSTEPRQENYSFPVILSRQYNYNVPTGNNCSHQATEAPHLFIISYDIHDNSIGTNMTSDSIRFSTRTQIYCINLSSSTCHTYRLDAHGWHQQPQIKMPIGLASTATEIRCP